MTAVYLLLVLAAALLALWGLYEATLCRLWEPIWPDREPLTKEDLE